jgi:hypothetical protein
MTETGVLGTETPTTMKKTSATCAARRRLVGTFVWFCYAKKRKQNKKQLQPWWVCHMWFKLQRKNPTTASPTLLSTTRQTATINSHNQRTMKTKQTTTRQTTKINRQTMTKTTKN